MVNILIPCEKTYQLIWSGKAIPINQRHGARIYNGKALIFNQTKYKNFINDMAITFRSQFKDPPIHGTVSVFISLSLAKKKGKASADTDAFNKQILDALEKGHIIDNDSQVIFQGTINAGADTEGITDTIAVLLMIMDGMVTLES